MKSQLVIKLAAVALSSSMATAGFADDYAALNGWRFLNFSDPTFSWGLYRDAFIGIPPAEDPWSSAFDVLFYEQVYKSKLSADGNCFGMSLLNLMIQKNGGHLGYCAPVSQYSGDPTSSAMGPTDPGLRRAINVMHGHQVNLPTVQFLLNIFAQHFNRDGAYAVDQLNYWQSRGDLTLVSITKDINPSDGGHTLIAYRAVDLGGGNKKIFVLDPNRTWGSTTDQAWYNSESNFIQITNHAWSFDMGGSTWSGDPGTGGNIVITPASVTGPLSRSPASLGDTIIGNLLNTLLLTGDDPHVEQVTDARGRRLYKPGTSELDTDPSTGMLNLLPWFLSDQRNPRHQPGGVLLFQLGESAAALRISVSAGPGGYTLRSMGGRTIVAVTARGGMGSDAITIRLPGTANATVSLENRRGATDYDVTFTRAAVPRQQVRVLSCARLRINGQGAAEVGLASAGNALQISASQASLRYDLALNNITRQAQSTLARSEVSQEPGASRTVQPREWQKLKDTQVLEQWRTLSPR
jgi:hypothetical protein